jgi:hypothetical protein
MLARHQRLNRLSGSMDEFRNAREGDWFAEVAQLRWLPEATFHSFYFSAPRSQESVRSPPDSHAAQEYVRAGGMLPERAKVRETTRTTEDTRVGFFTVSNARVMSLKIRTHLTHTRSATNNEVRTLTRRTVLRRNPRWILCIDANSWWVRPAQPVDFQAILAHLP